MTPSFWRAYLKRGHVSASTLPAVSYARLQGQEQLTKHFSLSAVMRDSDARKRPVFCQKNNVSHSEEANGEALPHELQAESGQFNLADGQPCYVSTSGVQDTHFSEKDLLGFDLLGNPESIAFLLGGGQGA